MASGRMEKGTGETRGGTPAHGNRSSIAAGRRVFDSQVGEPAPHKSLVECANRPRTDRRALMRRPVAFGAVSSSQWLAERLGGVCWRSVLAECVGGVCWRSRLAESVGGANWRRSPVATPIPQAASDAIVRSRCGTRLQPRAWRCALAERAGGASWRSGLAEWVGGVTWRWSPLATPNQQAASDAIVRSRWGTRLLLRAWRCPLAE